MENTTETKKSLKEIALQFFSSGLNENERNGIDVRKLERIQLINVYSIIATSFMLFVFIYFFSKSPQLLDGPRITMHIIYVMICILLFIYMRFARNETTGGTIIILFQYSLFFICMTYEDMGGALFIFISLIPYTVFHLKGAIRGLVWLVPFTIIYLAIIIMAEINVIAVQHSTSMLIYIFIGLINLSVFAVFSMFRIEQHTEIIQTQLREITEMSRIDYLTNILNKKSFMEILDKERQRSLRHNWRLEKRSASVLDDNEEYSEQFFNKTVDSVKDSFCTFSMLIMDIDHFKNINDNYGHLFGDEILRSIGEILQSKDCLRANDVAGRFGGEEFIVLLPETNADFAYLVAERLRKKIESTIYQFNDITNISVTISIGITESLLTDKNKETVIKRADSALYYAKANGKNCCKIYDNIIQ